MKLLVEFESKDEMDAFFASRQQMEVPQAVMLSNQLGQTIVVVPKQGEDGLFLELHQRGSKIDPAQGVPLPPGQPLKVL